MSTTDRKPVQATVTKTLDELVVAYARADTELIMIRAWLHTLADGGRTFEPVPPDVMAEATFYASEIDRIRTLAGEE